MDYTGKKVFNKKYGEGTITKTEGDYIFVDFANDLNKKYAHPTCFKSFLTLLDADVADAVDSVLKQIEEEERAEREKVQQEEEFRQIKKMKADASKAKDVIVTPFSDYAAFFENFKTELIREIAFLRSNGGKHQKIFDGKKIERKGNRYCYTFESEEELNLPEGTQITIWSPQSDVAGIIEACEDFTVILSVTTDLGDEILRLEFSAEPWRLIQSLIERLDEMSSAPSDIVKNLIQNGYNNIDFKSRITTGQDVAVHISTKQPISFIWGPPGTGKTQTLAKIALEHIQRDNRVLMLSYSNVSVDGAAMRVHKLSKNLKPGVLVRYGYPRLPELKEHEYLTSYNLTIRNHPQLLNERRNLIAERKKVSRSSARFMEISKRLSSIRNLLSDEEKKAIYDAKFVATTVSKAFADKTIWSQKFDVVIFDEASMAYIPQIIFSAGLATKHFICMGDFRQLPPIVQNSSSSILNADIFQYCGISRAVDLGKGHKWLCMLDTQYRMHPEISDFASDTMYKGLLKSASQMSDERKQIVCASPFSNTPIGYVDLSGMMSVCTKTADNSRVNPLSAFIAFSYALESAKYHEVGIITPYHAQSRLLHAMARDVETQGTTSKKITCATVHQFQGSEKDIVIYDAVDCYRMPYPGTLLTSTANNYANRLFNVALTRARGKFISIANIAYFKNKNLSPKLMFGKLTTVKQHSNDCQSGMKIAENRNLSGTVMDFLSSKEAVTGFLNDLKNAQNEVRIDIPNSPEDNTFITALANTLKEAKSRGVKVFIRAENKVNIPVALKPFTIENQYVTNPITLIDKKISWYGMPFSNAHFITEGTVLKTQYRPIIRFSGAHTALSLYGFMEMSRTADQSTKADEYTNTFANYVLENVKCNVCHKPMRIQKNRKGTFYLSCTGHPACNEMQYIEPDLVEQYFYANSKEGIRCVKCNCSLEAKMGYYGLYIQCRGSARHKYKLDEI